MIGCYNNNVPPLPSLSHYHFYRDCLYGAHSFLRALICRRCHRFFYTSRSYNCFISIFSVLVPLSPPLVLSLLSIFIVLKVFLSPLRVANKAFLLQMMAQ